MTRTKNVVATGSEAPATHTPGPWSVCEGRYVVIDRENGNLTTLAATYDVWTGRHGQIADAAANAAFIVRACNSHDAMKEALEECARYLDDLMDDMGVCPAPSDGWCSKLCETYGCMKKRADMARAALSKAGA